MNIGIAVDNTVPLHIPSFVQFFSAHSKAIRCRALESGFRFDERELKYEREVNRLSSSIRNEIKKNDVSLLITAIPYEDNFFFTGLEGLYIISLSDWHLLTTLPMSNGIAYMLCQILIKYQMRIGENHSENTGCVNDFWWDKSGIDVGMRAAFVCERCRTKSDGNPHLTSPEFGEIASVLNAISSASRRGVDILLEPAAMSSTPTSAGMAFLCHNSQDKDAVRLLNETLRSGGIRTWLDEEQIQPGELWQEKLEATISSIGFCLVIVGDSGFGPWQDMERRAFISEFANRGCKIIPVLIGKAERPPELPLFLKQFTWADLRAGDGRQLARLISALRGS
jgi:hypothetical protein